MQKQDARDNPLGGTPSLCRTSFKQSPLPRQNAFVKKVPFDEKDRSHRAEATKPQPEDESPDDHKAIGASLAVRAREGRTEREMAKESVTKQP